MNSLLRSDSSMPDTASLMTNLFMVVANYQIRYMPLLGKYERMFLFEGYASVFDPAADSKYAAFINEGVELADYTCFPY